MKHIWKRTAAMACGLALLVGCAGMGRAAVEAPEPKAVNYKVEDREAWKNLMADNQISPSFENALGQFAYQSGSRILSEYGGNVNYSPLSLYYALAIAGCGAKGETADQIMGQLGVEDQSQLAAQCRKLYQRFYYEEQRRSGEAKMYERDNNSSIHLGNSLWISDKLKLKGDYRRLAAEQFFASSYRVDFTKQETGEQIGDWISKPTNGVLQPDIRPDPDTMMAILNTLYFYGGWRDVFSESDTAEDSFTMEDGSKSVCPFMNRVDSFGSFIKGDGYTVSSLGTGNGCSMVFLLPDQGYSVDDFLSTPEQLESAMDTRKGQRQSGIVTWKVPKFSFGSTLRLDELLQTMGMERMYTPMAEFGGISKNPLMVSSVTQETHIAIDEKGVEGAAYTMILTAYGIFMANEDQKADMILDRPFIYGIQENSTHAWLFLGVCRNPADGQ